MQDRYQSAPTLREMIAGAQTNPALWASIRERATVSDDAVRRVEQLGGHWHLLVISADWCIDSMSLVPYLDALAERAGNLDLRIVDRDQNLDLMDAHLSPTGKRAIPVVVVYDEQFEDRGMWGSRPKALQDFIDGEGKTLPKDELMKAKRRWYSTDKGRSTVEEVIALLERVAAETPAHS
ncbi:MAG: thioredoxin family protein [Gemmatimonadetes bacterium]|nr:thioredoxin family protein [Gemmatimonadota bacterium]